MTISAEISNTFLHNVLQRRTADYSRATAAKLRKSKLRSTFSVGFISDLSVLLRVTHKPVRTDACCIKKCSICNMKP